MSSEQVIKATVWIEGEVDPGRYYVPNADMVETKKRLLKAGFREIDEPRAQFLQEIKATVRIAKEVSMGREGEKIPLVDVDPMRYYVPDADVDETRAKLREAGFEIEGHIQGCQGVGCGATCGCHCHAV